MPARNPADRIAFRYRPADSPMGVTRDNAKRLAQHLLLPQYEADEGPLTAAQVRQVKKRMPQKKSRSLRSSLFEGEAHL